MDDAGFKVRYHFEKGPVWGDGHLARFADASSHLLQSMPWAIPSSPVGTSAGLANGSLDLPGLHPEPDVRLRAIEYDGQALIERVYNREGRLERIDYFDGVSAQYGWNDRGWITSVRIGTEKPTRWTYRDDGLVTSVIYPDGGRFLFEYADDQRPVRRVYSDGWTITFHYDADNRLVEARAPEVVFAYPVTSTDSVLWRIAGGGIRHEMPASTAKVDIVCSPICSGISDRQYIISALGVWGYGQGQLRQMILPNGERLSLDVDSTKVRLHDSGGTALHYRNMSGQWTATVMPDGSRIAVHRLADGHRSLVVGPVSVSLVECDDSGRIVSCYCADGCYTKITRNHGKQVCRISTQKGWLDCGYNRAGDLCSIRSSTELRAILETGPSRTLNRITVLTNQEKVGHAGLFVAAFLWEVSSDSHLALGTTFCPF